MIYNISQPNTTLDSIITTTPFTFTLNGMILLFIIIICLALLFVIFTKKILA